MTTTRFVNGSTLSDGDGWANDVDTFVYSRLTGVAGTNTITGTGPASMTAYATGQRFTFIPANTNTGATTINITPSGSSALGAKNIFSGGVACVGGEIKASVPCELEYDGTQFNLLTQSFSGWQSPAFSAGDFTAGGSQTWTVASGDVTTYAYTIRNKVMTVVFQLDTTSVGGTPDSQLILAIPASKTATKTMTNAIALSDNGTKGSGFATVLAGGTSIIIHKIDDSNWTASTNATYVYGQITFEIN